VQVVQMGELVLRASNGVELREGWEVIGKATARRTFAGSSAASARTSSGSSRLPIVTSISPGMQLPVLRI
jgi:hypothetical protein